MRTKLQGFFAIAALAATTLVAPFAAAQSNEALERVKHDVKYLASDELEGRGVETKGIHLAADYIIQEYKKVGLKSGTKDGSFKQKFPVNIGRSIDNENTSFVVHHGDEKVELKLGTDFQAIMAGGTAEIEKAGVAFVGYAISSEDHNYDDFKGVDVKGKIVIMLTREPQADDKESAFDGEQDTRHARITTKLRAAKANGAVGAILIQDRHTTDGGKKDNLPQAGVYGSRFPRSARIPVAMIPRSKADEFLGGSPLKTATGAKLASVLDIEKHIDQKLEPVSQVIEGAKVSYATSVKNKAVDAFNIVGVIEGEGPKKDEVVVIGGHYDHLGMGPYGSRARGRIEVHNGADDNATGTAAVIELARRYAKYDKKPARTMVFVCFSGEERGLVGSNYWCNEEPLFPLDKTVAMINYDMIGWLRKGELTIYGSGTTDAFDGILDKANKDISLNLKKIASPFAGSDHMPFNSKKIPCMFLHTGLTDTYHTPEDDYETLNMEGAVKVIDYSEKMIWDLANTSESLEYKSPTRRPRGGRPSATKEKKAEPVRQPTVASNAGYLGIQLAEDGGEGVKIASVTEDSAAAKSGLREGDQVVKVGDKEVKSNRDLINVMSKTKAGESVDVELKRGDVKIRTQVKLGKRPTTSDDG